MKQGRCTRKQQQDAENMTVIQVAFVQTRETYGHQRLSKYLRQKGYKIGRTRVERLIRENNIVPKTVKKFKAATNSNHDYPAAQNLLNRNFADSKPNIA